MVHVNIGSGRDAPVTWLNLDASPVLRVQAILGALTPHRFPRHVHYADVARGLPVAENSVAAVFASHVLEHMSLEDMRATLRHIHRVLEPGGRVRLIVPDLGWRARRYVEMAADRDPAAAAWFMDATGLGQRTRPTSLMGALRAAFGRSAHRWMYDEAGMTRELARVGFVGIRRAHYGDSEDARFTDVERYDRFVVDRGLEECGLEAHKPASKY